LTKTSKFPDQQALKNFVSLFFEQGRWYIPNSRLQSTCPFSIYREIGKSVCKPAAAKGNLATFNRKYGLFKTSYLMEYNEFHYQNF